MHTHTQLPRAFHSWRTTRPWHHFHSPRKSQSYYSRKYNQNSPKTESTGIRVGFAPEGKPARYLHSPLIKQGRASIRIPSILLHLHWPSAIHRWPMWQIHFQINLYLIPVKSLWKILSVLNSQCFLSICAVAFSKDVWGSLNLTLLTFMVSHRQRMGFQISKILARQACFWSWVWQS